METIKRNSKEFKLVKELLDDHEQDAHRKRLIKLYSLRSGADMEDMVLINDAEHAAVVYDLDYGSVQDYMRDRSKKLFRDDKNTFYYFKSSGKSKYKEFPFEFTGKLKKQLKEVISS